MIEFKHVFFFLSFNEIQVPMEDLQSASKLLLKALKMRERYMRMSKQKFPNLVDGYIRGSGGSAAKGLDAGLPNKANIEGENFFLFFHSFFFSLILSLAFNVFFKGVTDTKRFDKNFF